MSAMLWLASRGAAVFVPVGHSPDVDLIADFGGELVRVQVKTSTFWDRNRWVFALRTSGGNQSWNGLVKRIDASRCDYVYAHAGDGRRWYIPISMLDGHRVVVLGGPKYSGYEVEPGAPLPSRKSSARGAPS
jgi:PD-(D/E)XK endonuclease